MKKLQRIAESKKIAGVCSGLGDYFDVDPVLFRLLFVVSIFFGGAGLLIYLVMWILVPESAGAEGRARPARRLHLSGSDRKIAGVCGGLGEWLDVDPVVFRIGFVVLALACGLGVLLYLILWMVVPRIPSAPATS
jgi:phage shock protein PspC (stress-responsive transcriptional regulator)